ncbi:MAG: TRAP transporter substrate-binding protein DctP [Thermoanaerobaculia bacterium]|nr:TRAP transporter substrate-binding protein DctP [Thermoanaerobaculia bacterium]
MSLRARAVPWILVLSVLVASTAGAATTLKLATLVPEGSVWDKELKEMGQDWREQTEGRVALRIYPGGVAGSEGDVLRKMRIGQLHAATLTVIGLSEIEPGFHVFAIPRFFRSYQELFHVVEALTPMFEQRLAEKGYVLLNWGHAGWIQLFTKEPVRTPGDLQKLKLFTSAGDAEMVQWWKKNGYDPVALSSTDVMTGLQTGMVEALPTTPLAALTLQWYRATPYMLDLGIAPLVGATIVAESTWERVDPADREVLRKEAREVGERLEKAVPEQDERAIQEMVERGLELTRPEGEAEKEAWEEEAKQFAATMRQLLVPDDVFEAAKKARDEYRGESGE